MSTDPSLALQGAFISTIKALNTEAAQRVYDRVPSGVVFPYVTYGASSSAYNGADCYDGSSSTIKIHVWSRAVGSPESKRIADAIRTALNNAELALSGHTLELLELEQSDHQTEKDGLTSHAILTFRALTQPAD